MRRVKRALEGAPAQDKRAEHASSPARHRAVLRFAVAAVLALAWMGVIFYMSANNADDSGEMSGGLIRRVLLILFGHADQSLIDSLDHPVRKLAHFTEYAVLGVLYANVIRAACGLREPAARCGSASADTAEAAPAAPAAPVAPASSAYERKMPAFLAGAWVFGVLYAISDEYHQSWVPGRSMQFSDVCIDASGVFAGLVLFRVVQVLVETYFAKR